jgi:hypothetical protein
MRDKLIGVGAAEQFLQAARRACSAAVPGGAGRSV